MLDKLFRKLFKRPLRMGNVGRTILIIAVAAAVIAAVVYVIFF